MSKKKFKGKAGTITASSGYAPTKTSVRFPTHHGSMVEVDVKRYEVAWNGHGPFVTLGIFDNDSNSMPRARVMLTPEVARSVAEAMIGAADV